ncbi:MAG TPA: hypothetical protein VF058_12040, partial [Actinomycetota bacterium]
RIRGAKSVSHASFIIPPDRAIGETTHLDRPFVPEETYLEIRLSQMYLRNEREYFREFSPLASLMTELLYAGGRRTVPVVVGPSLLSEAEPVPSGDGVEFFNTRVAGPYPYAGDDVDLFAGLFRAEVDNWAERALSLLETVAKALDLTKLSSFVNVSQPLVDGVEGLLRMEEMELRLGVDRSYRTPSESGQGSNTLRPGYEVLLRIPSDRLSEKDQGRFWVRDGRLLHGEDAASAVPFTDADFLLLEIGCLDVRHDYTTFDFHREHWKKVEEHIWAGRESDAKDRFKLLAASLVQSEDIVRPHRRRLLRTYKDKLDQEIAEYRELFEAAESGEKAFEGRAPEPIREEELQAVARSSGEPIPEGGPEEMLSLLEGGPS